MRTSLAAGLKLRIRNDSVHLTNATAIGLQNLLCVRSVPRPPRGRLVDKTSTFKAVLTFQYRTGKPMDTKSAHRSDES